ncbi:MAG: ABC transporter ATP-binding protein [Thermomicrobiales bacterium]
MARNNYAIEFQDVSRRFTLHHERRSSFQDWFIGLFKTRGEAEEFWALRNVTFGIRQGETFGLVGRNGAGKSTLLKLVTRILQPTEGSVKVNGRTYAMLELGAGFHPELSGRDNIFLNGSLYGFSRKDMQRKYEEIVEFAELQRFVDMPVKHFSSGMFARLGFGIAVNMDPSILVIDEVLAVGDSAFQQKCFRALDNLKARGTTILFVSHDADVVRDFCDRAALLVDGQLTDIGAADDVVDHYQQMLQTGEQPFRLLRIRALDEYRIMTQQIAGGQEQHIEVLIRVPAGRNTSGLMLQIDLDRIGGTTLWSTSVALPAELPLPEHAIRRDEDDAPDTRMARLKIDRLPVRAGQLRLVGSLHDPSGQLIDRTESLVDILPTDHAQTGLLALDHSWEWNDPTEPAPVESPEGADIVRR